MTLVFVISGVKVSMFTCGMTLVFVISGVKVSMFTSSVV